MNEIIVLDSTILFLCTFYTKMPRGTSKYKTEWEEEIDVSGEKISKWVVKINDIKVKCNICNKEIYVGTLGITALKRHAEQKKHKKNVESMISCSSHSTPSTSTSVPLTETESTIDDNATLTEQIRSAEAMWISMVAEHDIAFLMSDHASKIFGKMFPDSAIAAGFKCCRTKTNYMLSDGISVDLQDKLIQCPWHICIS